MRIFDYYGKKNIAGARIRIARKKKHLSQTDLAAQLQINGVILERDTISRIEIGDRFVADYELRTIAQILDVDIEWLLNMEEERC